MCIYSQALHSVEEIMYFNVSLKYIIQAEYNNRDFKSSDQIHLRRMYIQLNAEHLTNYKFALLKN